MDDYPSNRQRSSRPAREDIPEKQEPEKKITRVIEGEVVRRKKSRGKRFKELMLGGDGRSVQDMVLEDILVPGLRDIISDVINSSVEGVLYRGDSRSHHRRPSQRGGFGGGNVRYDRIGNADPRRRDDPRDRRRDISPRGRATHDFDEFILATRVEADEVLSQMYDLLERYDVVTVADLYQLVGTSAKYTDDKWGWTDLFGSGVTRTRGGGYLLDLPSPEPLRD